MRTINALFDGFVQTKTDVRTTISARGHTALAIAITMTLAGCGAIRPESARGTFRPPGVRTWCAAPLSRAHTALAVAAAADSAPAAHAALAAHAAAMHEYHTCTASDGTA